MFSLSFIVFYNAVLLWGLTMYVVATVDYDIAYEMGKIFWFPYLRIVYRANKQRDILFSCFTSAHTEDPLATVLLARKTDLLRIEEAKDVSDTISDYMANPDDVFRDIRSSYVSAKRLLEKDRRGFLDEMNLNIDWSRYRAIFLPSRRILDRDKPIFRYLIGNFDVSEYAVAGFIKFLIEKGLGINDRILRDGIEIISRDIVWYPILLGRNNNVYEPAWKLERSVILEWLSENNKFFKSLLGELRRKVR